MLVACLEGALHHLRLPAEQLDGYLKRYEVKYVLLGPALRWQARNQPAYSEKSSEILLLLRRLMTSGELSAAYSGENLVQVWKIER